MDFFLIVLLSFCQLNFACVDVPGELSIVYFQWVWMFGKKFPWKGDLQSDREND